MHFEFHYDVFLCYSARDKEVVIRLAQRLKAAGMRVWIDEWHIRPGDSIPSKIEHGLEYSRVLALCMSGHAFGTDWVTLESQTFRFRDPLNRQRRFIPLRLDHTAPKGTLTQFSAIDWRVEDDFAFRQLLTACQPVSSDGSIIFQRHTGQQLRIAFSPDGNRAASWETDQRLRLLDTESGCCTRVFEGGQERVNQVAFSPDGKSVLTACDDGRMRLWPVDCAHCSNLITLKGAADILSCAVSPGGRKALCGCADGMLRLSALPNGEPLGSIKGHPGAVTLVAFSTDGRFAISTSSDNTLRLWPLTGAPCNSRVLEGHSVGVASIALSHDGHRLLCGWDDGSLHLWSIPDGAALAVFRGHTGGVWSVAFSRDDRQILSGSADCTVRLWNVGEGRCVGVYEGHSHTVFSVAFSEDGHILSCSSDGELRRWTSKW